MNGTGSFLTSPSRQSPWAAQYPNESRDIPDGFSNTKKSDENEDADTPLDRVRDLIAEDKYTEAIVKLEEIIRANDKNIEAYLMKAGVLQLMDEIGKKAGAIKLYEFIIDKFPNHTQAYIELIEILDLSYKMQRDDNKIVCLSNKIKEIDENKVPYSLLAKAYNNIGYYELALESYNKAIEKEQLRVKACKAILENPKYSEEEKDFARGELDNDKLYEAYCGKAEILTQVEKYKESIKTYQEAITLKIQQGCEHESYSEYEELATIYGILGNSQKESYYRQKAEEFEKINDAVFDKERGYITDDEFNEWYDKHVEVDDDGNIINIKPDENKKRSPDKK